MYTDEHFEEMQYNPIKLRAYFWHMAWHWKRLSKEYRSKVISQGENYSVVGFKDVFSEGARLSHQAEVLDKMHNAVLSDLDAWVKSSLVPARCTCSR